MGEGLTAAEEKGAVAFFVPGLPACKGSTKSFLHRSTGRVVTMADDPRLKHWQASVGLQARAHGVALTEEAVAVRVLFFLPRPKGHYRANGMLSPSAPKHPTKRPDVDKMLRSILDALTGVAYGDDSQVVQVYARKSYTATTDIGAEIVLGVDP